MSLANGADTTTRINTRGENERMKLSIIIPAYNADAYLPKLLDTLDKQMQKDIEVLIVDDGSRNPVTTSYRPCDR